MDFEESVRSSDSVSGPGCAGETRRKCEEEEEELSQRPPLPSPSPDTDRDFNVQPVLCK